MKKKNLITLFSILLLLFPVGVFAEEPVDNQTLDGNTNELAKGTEKGKDKDKDKDHHQGDEEENNNENDESNNNDGENNNVNNENEEQQNPNEGENQNQVENKRNDYNRSFNYSFLS